MASGDQPPRQRPDGKDICFCTRRMACVNTSRVIGFLDGCMSHVVTMSGRGGGGGPINGAKEMVAPPVHLKLHARTRCF